MAHETTHHHHDTPLDKTPATPFKSSFWFVIILVGLFVAAVNFVNVMGHDDGGHGGGHGEATHETPTTHEGSGEHVGGAAHPQKEATSNQTLEGETGTGKAVEQTLDSPAHGGPTHQEGGAH